MSAEDATRKYIETLSGQRQAFIDTAVQAGYNADEVAALADEIFRVPDEKSTQLLVENAQAKDATQAVKDLIDSLPWTRRVQIIAETVQTGASLGSLGVAVNGGRAGGGIIPGLPSAKDNRIYAVATGEFIVNARQTAHPANRAALEWINDGGVFPGFADGGYAGMPSPFARQPMYERTTVIRPPAEVVRVPQSSFPESVTLMVGDREFTAYVRQESAAVIKDAGRGSRR